MITLLHFSPLYPFFSTICSIYFQSSSELLVNNLFPPPSNCLSLRWYFTYNLFKFRLQYIMFTVTLLTLSWQAWNVSLIRSQLFLYIVAETFWRRSLVLAMLRNRISSKPRRTICTRHTLSGDDLHQVLSKHLCCKERKLNKERGILLTCSLGKVDEYA